MKRLNGWYEVLAGVAGAALAVWGWSGWAVGQCHVDCTYHQVFSLLISLPLSAIAGVFAGVILAAASRLWQEKRLQRFSPVQVGVRQSSDNPFAVIPAKAGIQRS